MHPQYLHLYICPPTLKHLHISLILPSIPSSTSPQTPVSSSHHGAPQGPIQQLPPWCTPGTYPAPWSTKGHQWVRTRHGAGRQQTLLWRNHPPVTHGQQPTPCSIVPQAFLNRLPHHPKTPDDAQPLANVPPFSQRCVNISCTAADPPVVEKGAFGGLPPLTDGCWPTSCSTL